MPAVQALLPEKRSLFYSGLAKAVGSDFLARRIAMLRPDIHLFGHTHFGWDATYNGEHSRCRVLHTQCLFILES